MIYKNNKVIDQDILNIINNPLPWEKLKNNTIIISGASGFVPSYIVETLVKLNKKGFNIKIICIMRNIDYGLMRLGHLIKFGLEIIKHDITNPLPSSLPKSDYIIHAASKASPLYYNIDPIVIIEANITGTKNLLQLAKKV